MKYLYSVRQNVKTWLSQSNRGLLTNFGEYGHDENSEEWIVGEGTRMILKCCRMHKSACLFMI